MPTLSDLDLRTSYHKGRDDIAEEFYLPCMSRAIQYDRAVGFFRSTIFIIAWRALKDFVSRGGRMRILCSQVLSADDASALETGYAARADALLGLRLVEEVRDLLNDQVLSDPARILSALVANGTVDLQIAILREGSANAAPGRIFHDKLGIFRDVSGNFVVFKGSMNETWSGLSADGNLESVDVAASWLGPRDLERAQSEDRYFAELWTDRYPGLWVRPFPAVARTELERAADPNWEESVERLVKAQASRHAPDSKGRSLLPHQAAGLASWRANARHGILEFATGSGKTFTALTAIRSAIRDLREVVVVIVPDQVLFGQWFKELEQNTADLNVRILRAGAGYNDWRDRLGIWTSPGDQPRIVLATVQTAASEDFRDRMSRGQHLMLVADEVHRLGSPRNRSLLDEGLVGARLGLSATPERAGDPDGTNAILTFFGGILQPRYSLSDAVRDGVLTRYFYRPHTVQLSEDEGKEWKERSVEIARLRARLSTQANSSDDRLQLLLIKRARIVKRAAAKIQLAVDVLKREYQSSQRWIVYCEDLAQLNQVSAALLRAGIDNMPFHSQMTGDRNATLRWLERLGGVVVAIKCLDEGVDVPAITHALILASSKNPREFIQRRGRVLRRAPGKALAYIHDALVVPPRVEEEKDTEEEREASVDPITAGELARAVEFAQYAENPGAAADLALIAIDAGIDWRTLLKKGVEDEDD